MTSIAPLVYSFSVNTANLDLCSWNVVGVPMVNSMSMRFAALSTKIKYFRISYYVFSFCTTEI